MKIWYFNHYAGGPGVGKFMRAYHLGRAWFVEGHTSTIFVADYHHQLDAPERLPPEQTIDGIRYIALRTRRYSGNGLGRILNMMDYCWGMIRLPLRTDLMRPDAIIVSSPHPFGIFPAWWLARRFRAKLVFEVRDIWPLSVVEINGTSRWHPFVLACAVAERFAYRVADLVASLLKDAEPHMRRRGLSSGRFVHVPNGVDARRRPSPLPPTFTVSQAQAQIEDWRSKGRLIIVHPGAQGAPNALDRLLDAIALLAERGYGARVGLLLIGDGQLNQALKRQAKALKLHNVAFVPIVSQSEAQWLTSQCDVGYAGARNIKNVYQFGTSFNKVLDFMNFGLPVILPVNVGSNPVSESGCGIVTDEDAPEDIAKAILDLIQMSAPKRAALGAKGREHVQSVLSYAAIARKYIDAIETS